MGILIGISGSAGVGKDTAADYLVEHENFIKISFADPIKRIVKDVFDFSDKALWGPSEFRNQPDKRYLTGYDEDGKPRYLTCRVALQRAGTEFGRGCYKSIWIEYALRTANKIFNNPYRYDYNYKSGLFPLKNSRLTPVKGVVIPDCRFINEIDYIANDGGITIRVKRPGAGLEGAAGEHKSEKEQQGISDDTFNYVIDNEGTLDDFKVSVLGVYNCIDPLHRGIKGYPMPTYI